MAYKQEPCPLCGRNMTAIETYPGRGELYCGHCDMTIGGNDAKTPEELIALMDSSEHRRLKAENAKLRELAIGMYGLLETFDMLLGTHDACETPRLLIFREHKSFKDVMRELGMVDYSSNCTDSERTTTADETFT